MKNKSILRKLVDYAAIAVALPTIITAIAWGVGQLLPREIKDLPARVAVVEQNTEKIMQKLGIRTAEDERYNTKSFASGSPRERGNPPGKEMENQ